MPRARHVVGGLAGVSVTHLNAEGPGTAWGSGIPPAPCSQKSTFSV